MFQVSLQKQSPWGILINSYALFKASFLKCLPYTVLASMFALISMHIFYKEAVFQMQTPEQAIAIMHHAALPIFLNALNILVGFCIILQVQRVMDKGNTGLLAVSGQGIWRGILAIISSLIFMVAFFIVAFLIMLVLRLIPSFGPLLAIIILTIGSIYLFVSLVAWMPLLVAGSSPIKAFKQSFDLVKKNWWRTFMNLLILVVILVILEAIILSVAGISIRDAAQNLPSSWVASMAVMFVIALIMPIWIWSVIWLIIHDLRLRQSSQS